MLTFDERKNEQVLTTVEGKVKKVLGSFFYRKSENFNNFKA